MMVEGLMVQNLKRIKSSLVKLHSLGAFTNNRLVDGCNNQFRDDCINLWALMDRKAVDHLVAQNSKA